MAVLYACDATGKTVEDKAELTEVGMHGRLYHPRVAVKLREYEREVDKLHDKVSKEFIDGLAKLRGKYRKALDMPAFGKLPDE